MTVADLIELPQAHNPDAHRVEKRPAEDLTADRPDGRGDA